MADVRNRRTGWVVVGVVAIGLLAWMAIAFFGGVGSIPGGSAR